MDLYLFKKIKVPDLCDEMLKKLETEGLDVMMCHSTGYDNAAAMSGVHGEAIIKQFLDVLIIIYEANTLFI